MNFIDVIILGIVEGVTEYLPVSSTFHLIWTSKLLSLPQSEFQKTFEIVIQSGAILAVLVLYAKEILKNPKIIKSLIFSFFPTALVGLLLYKIIKGFFFENPYLQLFVFIFVGIIFIVFEKIKKPLPKKMTGLVTKDAVIVGLGQAFSVIPGVSRAGAVILTMMILGFKRAEAAKYSFLLAVPTLLSAGILDLYKSKDVFTTGEFNYFILISGIAVSFVSALIVVKWLVLYLQKNSLASFGWYRFFVGSILLILTLFL
jgi:undecaprenyl-diphosphatase